MTKINDLMNKLNLDTEEDLLNIDRYYEEMYSKLKETENSIRLVTRHNKISNNDELEEIADKLDEVLDELDSVTGVISELEDMADNNYEWGNEWKKLCLYIIEKYDINIDEIV